MWQCMCYWECYFKVHYFCQNFFGWKNWYGSKQKYQFLVEGKRLSHLSDSLKSLKVQDNKITLSFMCLFVISYSAYQKKKKQKTVNNKNTNNGLSLHLENILEQKIKWNKLELKLPIFLEKVCAKNIVDTFSYECLHN